MSEGVVLKFSLIGSNIFISIVNQLVYDDLVGRMKEKEEKEARKLQRLAEEFTDLLRTLKVYLTHGLTFCFFPPRIL